jgi:hypothetical protein
LSGALQLAQAEAVSIPELFASGELSPSSPEPVADAEMDSGFSSAREPDK